MQVRLACKGDRKAHADASSRGIVTEIFCPFPRKGFCPRTGKRRQFVSAQVEAPETRVPEEAIPDEGGMEKGEGYIHV
jgi:nitrite reductase/ring-hydroxylating ferredoxin subunit